MDYKPGIWKSAVPITNRSRYSAVTPWHRYKQSAVTAPFSLLTVPVTMPFQLHHRYPLSAVTVATVMHRYRYCHRYRYPPLHLNIVPVTLLIKQTSPMYRGGRVAPAGRPEPADPLCGALVQLLRSMDLQISRITQN